MPNKKSGSTKPTQSFEQMVSDATLSKLKPFISDEVLRTSKLMVQEQMGSVQALFERLTAVEKIITEKLGISDDEYVNRVTDVQDELMQVKSVSRACKAGDILRVEVSTKKKEQTEYQGSTRMMISSLGSGSAIGKDLELSLIGLKAGETKVVEFGQNKELEAKIFINRVSGKEE